MDTTNLTVGVVCIGSLAIVGAASTGYRLMVGEQQVLCML